MTSSRETVLGAVRAALGPRRRPSVPVDRSYRERGAEPANADVVELFAERVADYRASVVRCTRSDLTATVASCLGDARSV
ncbi:MAG: lactate utilization protein C, partial [Dermatophilaceae bacterium]